VAYDALKESHPKVLEKANSILAGGVQVFTSFEKDYPFVECATFADEIKDTGFEDQSHWHFVDQPYFDDGFKRDDVYP
jgi:hypothetical protein